MDAIPPSLLVLLARRLLGRDPEVIVVGSVVYADEQNEIRTTSPSKTTFSPRIRYRPTFLSANTSR